MYIIDHNEGFGISFGTYIDRDEFQDLVNYLKGLFLYYKKEKNFWAVPDNRMDEIILWFQRDRQQYKITENAQNKIEELKKQYVRETIHYRERKYNNDVLNSNFKAFKKQEEAISWCLKRNTYLNAMDTGSGKSGVTIAHVQYLFKNNLCDKFIIITPLGTGYNWEYQIKEFTDITDDEIGYIENNNKDKPFENLKDKKIIIISNHILAKTILSYKEDSKEKKNLKNERWVKQYVDLKKVLDCKTLGVIVDESHFFKKSTSIKTKALLSLKEQFDYRFLLTATPNINRFEHIYTQMKFVDNSIIPLSENAFKLDISYSIGSRFDRYHINAYNTGKVNEYLEKFKTSMIQIMKSDFEEFNFEKVITPIYNKLHPLQKQMYQRVCEIELNKLQEEYDKVTWQLILNKFPMLLTVVDCPSVIAKNVYDDEFLLSLLSKWKLEYDPKYIQLCGKLEDYIDEQDEKVIIFDPSPHVLNLLYEKFEKYNPLMIHGQLKDEKDKEKERTAKVELFNNDPKYKLFLLSTHTSSGSLNLQKSCHRSIIYTCPQDAVELRQLQDRTFRITSTEDTLIDIMTFPETIDNVRYKRAMKRLELNDKLTKEITQEELDRLLWGIV